MCVRDYFQKEPVRGEYFADGYYHEVDVIPQIEDLAWLRAFKFVDADHLYHLVGRIVKPAEEELRERGFGEECYLEPLYHRVKSRENPARRMLRVLDAGRSIEEIILEYREL